MTNRSDDTIESELDTTETDGTIEFYTDSEDSQKGKRVTFDLQKNSSHPHAEANASESLSEEAFDLQDGSSLLHIRRHHFHRLDRCNGWITTT